MLLADLSLTELPTSALLALKKAIYEELHRRKKQQFIETRLIQHQQSPALEHQSILGDRTHQVHTCKALPPEIRTHEQGYALRYLPKLLIQNWYDLFPQADDTEKCCYVYAHIDPRKPILKLGPLGIILPGTPFYIGKGTGQRAYDLKRNDGHRKILSAIRAAGFPHELIVHILTKPITELQALTLEAKLIYFFGSMYEHVQKPGCLINLADHIRPNFVGVMDRIDGKTQPTQSFRLNIAPPRKQAG